MEGVHLVTLHFTRVQFIIIYLQSNAARFGLRSDSGYRKLRTGNPTGEVLGSDSKETCVYACVRACVHAL